MRNRLMSSVVGACLVLFLSAGLVAQQSVERMPDGQAKMYKREVDVAKLATALSMTVPPPTIVQVDIEDTVAYVGDVPYDALMTLLGRTLSSPKIATNVTAIGDVRRINGRPARGMYVNIAFPIFTTPNPSPETGFSIADSVRFAVVGQSFDLWTTDGNQIGSIFGWGFAFGDSAPGAPLASGGGSVALTAGTGPYLGIRGGMYTTTDTSTTGPNPSVRFASAGESPALRRINKGGTTKFLLQLLPSFPADVLMLDGTGTPAVFHIYDESVVTRSNPAAAGEIVSALVRNLGPTKPALEYGQAFSRAPSNRVNSPVEVRVNGVATDVTYAAGHPGSVNVYDLEFLIPKSTPSGLAAVQVFVGYVGGIQFPMYVE
jgi:uncharacterized protein (TIGR03437 family)